MSIAELTAWLATPDFTQGVALYAQAAAPSPTYQRLFALGASDYARQVLHRELRACLVSLEADVAAWRPPPPPEPPVAPAPAPELPTSPDSPHLPGLYTELRQLRDERSHLHPQLTARGTGQVRRLTLAGRIVTITHREVELKALVDYVQQHGRLPGPVPLAEVTDPLELQRRLLNLRSRRSKLRRDPARAAELAQVETDIDYLTTKLKS